MKLKYSINKHYCITLFFSLLFLSSNVLYSQKKSSSVVRKSLRHLKNGKKDTLLILQTLAGVLDNKDLKSKHRKKINKVFGTAYSKAIHFSELTVKSTLVKIDNETNPYKKYQYYETITASYNNRLSLASSLKNLETKLDNLSIEDTENITIKINIFNEKTEIAKAEAAEDYYNKGKQYIQNAKRKKDYHIGYRYLKSAERLISPYKDAYVLKKEAKKKGAIYVKVLTPDYTQNKYSNEIRKKVEFQIKKNIEAYNNSTPFLHTGLHFQNPDYTIKLLINAPVVKTHRPNSSTEDVKRTITTKEKKEIEVTARFTRYEKSLDVKVTGIAYLRDSEGHVIKQFELDGYNYWTHYWATYTGDERALSGRQKNRLGKDKSFPQVTTILDGALNYLNTDLSKPFEQLKKENF